MSIQDSPLARKLGPLLPYPRRNWLFWQICTGVAGHSSRGRIWSIRDKSTRPPISWPMVGSAPTNSCPGTRQIVDFQIPGDFLGLRSVLFRTADHNIEPITTVEASEVLARDLLEAFAKTPRLATAVLWAASRDEAMVVEHLVDLGRRNALERTVHFLLELGARLKLVGLGSRRVMPARCRNTCFRMRWD